MISQTRDTQRFAEEVRHIKASVPAILAQWGLRSKFARWRLTQDPGTGLVVLFGVLNTPNADSWVKSRAEVLRRPYLILDGFDNLARLASKSERALDKAARIANARRQRGIVTIAGEA